ncbi:MAG: ferrous iron transport protein B [Candidatus Krumholzibacteria bacterium]|nr:ferrous iron transport protein B [Candidatus Krumholzibacteria bacterium]
MADKITVALAGNPNSGKTTVFNAMTGARHHVGNYPGVTVEKKEGRYRHGELEVLVTDLPGIYSMTADSVDEIAARNHLVDGHPDILVDIIDCSNLERNLYLATQLLELGIPLLLAFNMSDVAQGRGIDLDLDRLSERLGTPIVRTVGHKGKGIEELKEAIARVALGKSSPRGSTVDYGSPIEREIEKLERLIALRNGDLSKFEQRWLAVKLLESDEDIAAKVTDRDIISQAESSSARLAEFYGDDLEVVMADRRYAFISGICRESVRVPASAEDTSSDRIDSWLTHRWFGLPIFLLLMYMVFHLTFTLGNPLSALIENGFGWLGATITAWWPPDAVSPLQSLLVDGIIGGVGSVIVFLPNILLLFLAIAVLEDTGYMARAAFMMDRMMYKVGLHGKSFIPMLIGFGCNVPAIMATRTLDRRRDRLITMLIIPLMSCSARLTIYALIIPAFFPQVLQAPMLWMMYIIGIILAIAAANLLRVTVFKGETSSFMMELPPYRMPSPTGVFAHMWERAWLYVRKAGTIILGVTVVLWAMTSFPKKVTYDRDYESPAVLEQLTQAEVTEAKRAEDLSYSVAGRMGRFMEPALRPMGFDWRIGTALVGAFAAKEVFVAQMGIVYSVGQADESSEALRAQLKSNYSPLVAFCILLFVLIGTPCMATVAITRRESNSWKWALFQFTSLTVLAYFLTVLVYQLGKLVGIGV